MYSAVSRIHCHSNGIPTTARELVALDSKKKMTNFERAILENRVARCHMHDLRAYLVHFGKDFARFFLQGAGPKLSVTVDPLVTESFPLSKV